MLKRLLIFVHRWLGAAVTVMLTLWFSSGIVMMYHGFPEITMRQRLAHEQTLAPETIKVSPGEAAGIAHAPGVAPVRLAMFAGRPAYLFPGVTVYADTGSEQRTMDSATIARAAAAWAGEPAGQARSELLTTPDQWTLSAEYQFLFPMQKFSWPDGQQVYVQRETADVVQYTTTSSRGWAYVGAIPHWLYFGPLREHSSEWLATMKWAAITGSCTGVLGLVVGVWVYSPRRRYRYNGAPARIPYRTWKRWHTVVGLIFGVVTITWSFSGLLSMGPFPFMRRLTEATIASAESSDKSLELDHVVLGAALPLAEYASKPAPLALASLDGFPVKEFDYVSLDGVPMYIASGAGQTRIVPISGSPTASFDAGDLMRRIERTNGPNIADMRLMTDYDRYYVDRRGDLPLPVIRVSLNDAVGTRYYIDPATASIVNSYSARGWVHRWLFHGLHSMNLPWMYKYRPLWDVVMIALLLGGALLCATSLVLTVRLLARKVRWVLRRVLPQPRQHSWPDRTADEVR